MPLIRCDWGKDRRRTGCVIESGQRAADRGAVLPANTSMPTRPACLSIRASGTKFKSANCWCKRCDAHRECWVIADRQKWNQSSRAAPCGSGLSGQIPGSPTHRARLGDEPPPPLKKAAGDSRSKRSRFVKK
jgi:hypothetical protein